jgi:hypothetical protein
MNFALAHERQLRIMSRSIDQNNTLLTPIVVLWSDGTGTLQIYVAPRSKFRDAIPIDKNGNLDR